MTMKTKNSRREFIRNLGISGAAANLLLPLPSLGWEPLGQKKQRIIFVFSPNGVIPKHFWPEEEGENFQLKRILEPLAPFKDQLLTLRGIDNRIKGDGDGHMRGIGCLLTGVELFPGDVQGGSDTPAGWSMGISIDQHLKNKLQANANTRTRFGSLEFGVLVPDRADTWTRWSYAGPNQPVAPISDPYQMFNKLYGNVQNRMLLASVLDDLSADFKKVENMVSSEDRQLLQRHVDLVRSVELELKSELEKTQQTANAKNTAEDADHAVPELPPNVQVQNDNMRSVACRQICCKQPDVGLHSGRIDANHQQCRQSSHAMARH